MFKFTVLCLMAVFASAIAAPGLVSPLAAYGASPYATQIGYGAPYVAPYASSYNAHQIDHAVAYPAYQYASAGYAAPGAYAGQQAAYATLPAAYAASPAGYAAAPAGYPFPAAYASHPGYAASPYASALYK
ncbi:postacrosomal sheath WW domain-binding protein-like [Episyrphus balteatus]|uniref:postacrosomal sheath WW domain-binding protein-like n=1 Tax=Episyrphus balteatus TaxID=286459 RepID=UPI0024862290|nr:postacrosomal sheath WW domain-binding protein-like [Episyrphus balteatus]